MSGLVSVRGVAIHAPFVLFALGLGLWLGREFAHMHDADPTVRSMPIHRGIFTLRLPLTQ